MSRINNTYQISDYATTHAKISGGAELLLHLIRRGIESPNSKDSELYLQMALESAKSIIDLNDKSWKAYLKLNFGIEEENDPQS